MSVKEETAGPTNTMMVTKTGSKLVGYYSKPNESSSQEIVWQRNQILSLISNYEKFYEDFYDGKKKKKTIWEAVAKEMAEEGYQCTGADCGKKWSNLKATYLKVLKKHSHGISSSRFEYFDAMHHLLGKAVDPLRTSNNGTVPSCEALPDEREIIVPSDYQELHVDSKGFEWIPEAVNLLLDHIRASLTSVSSVTTIQEKWDEIAEKMNNEGYLVTNEQCQQKWENMQDGYFYHQATSQISGRASDWSYYAYVQDIMVALNIPTSVQSNFTIHTRPSSERVVKSQNERKTSFKRKYAENDAPIDSTRSLLDRVQHLESNFSIHRRIDALEERVNENARKHEVYSQTNSVLTQIVSELRKINEMFEAENSKFYTMQHLQHSQRQGSPSQDIIIVEDLSAQL